MSKEKSLYQRNLEYRALAEGKVIYKASVKKPKNIKSNVR